MTRPALRLADPIDRDAYVPARLRGVLDGEQIDPVPATPADLRPVVGQPFVTARVGLWYGGELRTCIATPETTSPAWWAEQHPGRDVVLSLSRGGWATEDAAPIVVARWHAGDPIREPVVLEVPAEVALLTDVGPTLATLAGTIQGRPAYQVAPTGWTRLVVRQIARWGVSGLRRAVELETRRGEATVADSARDAMRRLTAGGAE